MKKVFSIVLGAAGIQFILPDAPFLSLATLKVLAGSVLIMMGSSMYDSAKYGIWPWNVEKMLGR